jgi:23S rRNA pseudouridine2605 synthase
MAKCGVASRRKSEKLIEEGHVSVNGKIIRALGTLVAEGDQVCVDGQVISLEEDHVYIMLHKPLDCVTTSDDQFGRKTVLDFVDDLQVRVYPVGRLDYQTTGLLLLTNDGDLSYKITHPSSHMNKIYHAQIDRLPSKEAIERLEAGLVIDGYQTSEASFKVLKTRPKVWVEIVIHEGRNRQVRKMLDQVGVKVLALKRVGIGELTLGTLAYGKYRHLTQDEINYLATYEVKL